MRARGVIVRVELDPDPSRSPAACYDQFAQFIKRVFDRVMHQVLGERDDVLRRQIGRDMRGFGVLGAAEPERRILIRMHQHRLRRIEGPAVEAGQPAHAGRVLADQQIQPGRRHPAFHIGDPALVFGFGKRFFVTHWINSVQAVA